MKATHLFNNWVDLGKDNGMVLNHGPSVEFMLNLIPQDLIRKHFSFVDIGCGNGWVVKKISQYEKCQFSLGIDGAEKMIKKAKLDDSESQYLHLDINHLESYQPNIDFGLSSFDIVFSMEVLYYLQSPELTLKYISSNLLKEGGCCIIGVDHYLENKPSLSWEEHLKVPLCTYSIKQWKEMFNSAGFSTVKQYQFGQEKDWSGTLIFYGEK